MVNFLQKVFCIYAADQLHSFFFFSFASPFRPHVRSVVKSSSVGNELFKNYFYFYFRRESPGERVPMVTEGAFSQDVSGCTE